MFNISTNYIMKSIQFRFYNVHYITILNKSIEMSIGAKPILSSTLIKLI